VVCLQSSLPSIRRGRMGGGESGGLRKRVCEMDRGSCVFLKLAPSG
jgi:hypothetical protein